MLLRALYIFRYLKGGIVEGVWGRVEELEAALRIAGFTEDQVGALWRVLAAILHVGEISFEAVDEAARIRDPKPLQVISRLLELPGDGQDGLAHALCHRPLSTAKEFLMDVPLKIHEAEASRDALAKILYCGLFDWIVAKLNALLLPPPAAAAQRRNQNHRHQQQLFIGVLDIYGFERFDDDDDDGDHGKDSQTCHVNSFEQFCINYANERLQQEFILQVFAAEQAEYLAEGLPWTPIDYADNKGCIELIEGSLGILALLDEVPTTKNNNVMLGCVCACVQECRFPKGTDRTFLEKLDEHCGRHQCLAVHRDSFILRHFAYDVEYAAGGFLEKNRDAMPRHLLDIFSKSGNPIISHAMSSVLASNGKSVSVASSFRGSLGALLERIRSTQSHYIRCIKPNDDKAPRQFHNVHVLRQLRACGIIETIRIGAAGFPSRWLHGDFCRRYGMLLAVPPAFRAPPDSAALDVLVKEILGEVQSGLKEGEEFWIGRTRVFLRAGLVGMLEGRRTRKLHSSAQSIQDAVRRAEAVDDAIRKMEGIHALQRVCKFHSDRVKTHKRLQAALLLLRATKRCSTINRTSSLLEASSLIQSTIKRLLTWHFVHKLARDRSDAIQRGAHLIKGALGGFAVRLCINAQRGSRQRAKDAVAAKREFEAGRIGELERRVQELEFVAQERLERIHTLELHLSHQKSSDPAVRPDEPTPVVVAGQFELERITGDGLLSRELTGWLSGAALGLLRARSIGMQQVESLVHCWLSTTLGLRGEERARESVQVLVKAARDSLKVPPKPHPSIPNYTCTPPVYSRRRKRTIGRVHFGLAFWDGGWQQTGPSRTRLH